MTSQKNVGEDNYSIACVADLRKGRGRKYGRETTRPESPSCSLSTGGPEKELGQTCVQSQSSREIRNTTVLSEFTTFLKIIKSKEQNFFTVNSFYPIYG